MTAFHAARGGLRVLLVDRAPLGRTKACGDALTPNAVAAVRRMGAGDPPWHMIRGFRVHTDHRGCGTERFDERSSSRFGATIERRYFDAWLVERAIDAGAEFQVGEVVGLRFQTDCERVRAVELRGQAGCVTVHADHVVFATGAAVPRFAKNLIVRTLRPRHAAAVRGYVCADGDVGDFLHTVLPVFSAGAALPAYAWAFPVDGGALAN